MQPENRTPENLTHTVRKTSQTTASDKFNWNEREQGNVLGSFFWFHWLTQIPGGFLATKYGTKKVYGITNFLGVVCCFLIPYCAYKGPIFVIIIRALQGLICVSIATLPQNTHTK